MIRPVRRELDTSQVIVPPRRRARQTFKKHDVMRAMAAVRDGGLEIASVEISLDGRTIRFSNAQAASANGDKDEFSKWADRL